MSDSRATSGNARFGAPAPRGSARAGAVVPAKEPASAARLRAIIDSALDAIVSTDAESVITGWSAHAERMFGWTAAEALGRRLGETIIPERHRAAHDAGVRRYLATGQGRILNRRVEITALRRGGAEFPVELTVAAERADGEVFFSAFIRDLTEQKRAEARLTAEHAVTRVLAEATSVGAAAEPILRAMGEPLGWDVGYLWTVDDARLRAVAHWHAEGFSADEFAAVTREAAFEKGEGMPGRAWSRGEPVWVVDAVLESNFPRAEYAVRAGLHGAVAFPALAGSETLGVLEFFSRAPEQPDDALLAMARSIGSDVGQAFRRMHAEAELDRALAAARAANETLRRVNAQLALRSDEAERANRAKSDFLAVMSHELRTPVNAVLGYTDLLEMGIGGSVTAEQRGYLERVRASTRHLLGLINDVLDLSKIEAGRMGVARAPAHAVEAVAEALSLVTPQAEAKGLTLDARCPPTGAEYVGDHDRVTQIVTNLLSNAVKFTAGGGRVTVRCGTGQPSGRARLAGDGPWAFIRVDDTGVGMAPEETEAVFEPFVQAEAVHTRKSGGTGLGLTISRRLARLMGGDVTLETELGRGSSFTLWLPATTVEEPAPEPPPGDALAAPPPIDPAVLRHAGDALKQEISAIMADFVERVRSDPLLAAAGVTTAELEDHQAPFVADVAQCLTLLGEAGGDVALLHDGTELQRLVAFRHGEQRARLGWTESALQREFDLFAAAVRDAVARRGVPQGAWDVISRFVNRAEEVATGSLCAARGEAAGE